MLALARRLAPLAVALLTLASLLGCGQEEPTSFGRVLPADTMAWLHLGDLPSLEVALESHGLMDLLVAELDDPETREQLQSELGLTLAEDPRVTVHALLQELRSADVSVHPVLHESTEGGPTPPAVVVHLECADEAAAGRVLDLVRERADGEIAVGGQMALQINAEDELAIVIGQNGAHVVLSNEAERWGEVMGDLIDPPATGLIDTEAYQRLVPEEGRGTMMAYVTPEAQAELRGFPMPAPGVDPVTMQALMEKYGSQYAYLSTDYLLGRMVSRQMMTSGSPLEPLMECQSGRSELLRWLPTDTFVYEGWLVENGREKLELIRTLLTDVMGSMSGALPPGQMPPGSEDPVMAVETALGFSLAELADRVREVAIAGTGSTGWLLMMRAHDETQAQEIVDLFGGCPLLAMVPEGEPVEVGGTSLRSFALPTDERGSLQLMGRHDDTMLMAFMVPDAAAIEGFLGQAGQGALMGAVPTHASRQLEQDACGWGYLDLSALLAAVGQGSEDAFDELPPPLAQRLRELRLAGHMAMLEGGVSETVVEIGQP
jgi:hypothetical protein